MITCPNCKHTELVGALFCSECGTQLIFSEVETVIYPAQDEDDNIEDRAAAGPEDREKTLPHPMDKTDSIVSLTLIDSGETLSLGGRTEVTLGRISKGQPIVPDVDLSPYKAYEAGVSRLHASLKTRKSKVIVSDLGSANGTRVNGQKIPPQSQVELQHGDILTLGTMKIQILIHNK